MLVFVDESGDTGMQQAGSDLFTVSLVVFEDHDQAQAVDNRINLLRQELGLPADFEFHFGKNSNKIRFEFLKAIAPYEFWCYGFVVNKAKLYSPTFQNKSMFYNYMCGLVFENAKATLDNAIVKIDKSGDRDFERKLTAYLKKKINDPTSSTKHIKKVNGVDSSGNNLVQIADMVCGAITRSYRMDRKDAKEYRKIIAHREISVRYWPE